MKRLIILIAVMLVAASARAEEAKPGPLADYVRFCLALWNGDSDLQSKANALGLKDVTGSAGAFVGIGKSTIRFYKSLQGSPNVGSTLTTFEDGKESSCVINLPTALDRSELESTEKAMDLDGQIMVMGPAIITHWKLRKRQPPVLLKVVVGKAASTITIQTFEPTPAGAKPRHSR